jgi:hypothetical protein
MKNLLLRFAPSFTLLMAGVFGLPHYASTATPPPEHPHIRAAINELREARNELEHAAHDFCGHRAAAVRDSQAALNQLQEALRCAK